MAEQFRRKSRRQALESLLAEAAELGVTIRFDAEAALLLDWAATQQGLSREKVQAITLGKDVFVRAEFAENVRVLREELIHVVQQSEGMAHDEIAEKEIEARLQMIRHRQAWGITNDEVREMVRDIRHIRERGRY